MVFLNDAVHIKCKLQKGFNVSTTGGIKRFKTEISIYPECRVDLDNINK